MKNIRLVALDLDGTLLDDNKNLPEDNRKALEACVTRGIYVVPCTGRLSTGIPQEILDIGVRYAITINGGAIEDLKTQSFLDKQLLDKETALFVMDMVREYPNVMCDAYVDNQGISESKYYDHLYRFGMSEVIQNMIRRTRSVVPNIIDYIKEPGRTINKINMYFASLEEKQIIREKLKQVPGILVTSSVHNNLEINGCGAEKGSALLRLADHLGISQDETMAFGDGENDYSLIEKAGLGVVMENGIEGLKAIADYITGTNNDAGVARTIEAFILNHENIREEAL